MKGETAQEATILVAEDEPGVRSLLLRILRLRGYRVLGAANGEEALAAAASEPVDLLITDLVMTDMNGRQLADRLAGSRPGLKVLFISGYADDSISDQGVLVAGTPILEKPFSAEALSQRVREILGRPI